MVITASSTQTFANAKVAYNLGIVSFPQLLNFRKLPFWLAKLVLLTCRDDLPTKQRYSLSHGSSIRTPGFLEQTSDTTVGDRGQDESAGVSNHL